ncbi:putative Co/Zn/Cd efflux system membrane fusion protein (plasmid) [Paraburkholderia caribensis MBA4]|uniref:Putative Co/Zn/Cd efflux system membrane fusion protein n=1 Tax=Paraburkholderia caribensis MBA4 TaxID=1323664 RepID=A0A0P0RQH6_9BURK|nr:efflux RND transporter periplasmic adaptor subunit [Paraburkholderia caribensis]ALL71280.1 putative Co/Zn/Cd efflux system membrane fusion protein [Paraburkholderia caribensis MBA4]
MLIAAGVVAVGVVVWQAFAAFHKPPHPVAQATPVTIGTVTRADVPLQLDALGTVTPRATVTVKTQVNGTLEAMLAKEGQRVKAGQPIARIDSRALRAQLLEAQGTLEHDEALLANARADLTRYESLIDGGSISHQTLDTQRATLRQYQGTVKADQGSVANLRVQVGYCEIVAPMDGTIGLLSTDAGNYVTTSDTTGIATITSDSPTTVVYALPEDKLGDVVDAFHDKGALPVDIFARDKRTVLDHATLAAIDNQADTTTGTVKLKASAPNRDGRLFPNRFVNVRMTVGTLHDALTVPTVAIQHGASGDFVLTLAAADAKQGEGKVALRRVTAGVAYNDATVIEQGGLKAGDTIVLDGADKLDDGSAVKIVRP